MGLAYSLPQVITLELPFLITVILLLRMTILMMALVWSFGKLIKYSPLLGSIGIGTALVILDWINFTIFPIWAMAQSFVRPWSSYPTAILFVSLTGITGIIFIIGFTQSFIVISLARKSSIKKVTAIIGVTMLVILVTNVILLNQKQMTSLKVAAIGWTDSQEIEYGSVHAQNGFDLLFAKPISEAAANGAKFIVSPELGFEFGGSQRNKWLQKFGEVVKNNKIYLAAGYLNTNKNENRMLFMDPDGEVIAEYTKTYLTPFENFQKGNGRLVTVDINDLKVGGMICHDDNYTCLSRKYGRKQVSIVAVPTLDWKTVKQAHLQSSIHRAIESRYAVVRATIDGISAIISPNGKVLAQKDHFLDGAGVVIAEVPLYSTTTLFSKIGHWPVILALAYLLFVCRFLRF